MTRQVESPTTKINTHQGTIKQISCSLLFLAVVLAQLQELIDVRVPRFQVDCYSTLPLATTLTIGTKTACLAHRNEEKIQKEHSRTSKDRLTFALVVRNK